MEITTNLINEEEFINMAIIYNDIQNYFGNSINLNPQFVNEINAVYKRAFLNMGKSMLSVFNLKYLEMFEQLAEHYKCNEELYDLSISLLNVFNEDFKQLNDNLDVQNEKDFNELK